MFKEGHRNAASIIRAAVKMVEDCIWTGGKEVYKLKCMEMGGYMHVQGFNERKEIFSPNIISLYNVSF